jgi:hypothetical protein
MDMDTTTITNNGVITRITVTRHDYRNYSWGILAVLVFALLAGVLRKIFWRPDSN